MRSKPAAHTLHTRKRGPREVTRLARGPLPREEAAESRFKPRSSSGARSLRHRALRLRRRDQLWPFSHQPAEQLMRGTLTGLGWRLCLASPTSHGRRRAPRGGRVPSPARGHHPPSRRDKGRACAAAEGWTGVGPGRESVSGRQHRAQGGEGCVHPEASVHPKASVHPEAGPGNRHRPMNGPRGKGLPASNFKQARERWF